MTTVHRTVLIIATVLVIGGLGTAAWAFGAAGFSFENLSTTARDWTQTTRTLDSETDAPHTSIVVRDSSENIRFEPTSADAVEVTYWTSGDKSVSVTDEGGTLTVEGTTKPHRGLMLMSIDLQNRTTVVKVPLDYTGSISVETESGNVEMAELAGLASASVATASGNIEAARLEADDISLHATSGDITASSLQANRIEALATSGSVTMSDSNATETIETGAGSGNLYVNRTSALAMTAHSTSGSINATSLEAANIALEATSGDVYATVAGSKADYEVRAASSSGTVNVPQTAARGGKVVSLRTSSGSIDLEFTTGGNASAFETPEAPEPPEAPEAPKVP